MGLEIWVAVYTVVGLLSAVLFVWWLNKIDSVTGDDNYLYVGLPVFFAWPVVIAAVLALVVYNKVRKIRTHGAQL